MTAFALLLLPALASATPVSIDWTGQIFNYVATPDSGFPQAPLSTNAISGNITYDTSLLPAPDAGNPPGVFSFTGDDFIHSTVQWAGGVFQPDIPGSTASDSLLIDSLQGEVTILDSGTYVDPLGNVHTALVSFDMLGLPDAFTSTLGADPGTPANGTAFVSGGGVFTDLTQGLIAPYQLDNATVSVPEPGTLSLWAAALLGLVVMRRPRRSNARREI
jgi:hypothetical protein